MPTPDLLYSIPRSSSYQIFVNIIPSFIKAQIVTKTVKIFWKCNLKRLILSRISVFKKNSSKLIYRGFPGWEITWYKNFWKIIIFRGDWPPSENWMFLKHFWIQLGPVGKWCSTDCWTSELRRFDRSNNQKDIFFFFQSYFRLHRITTPILYTYYTCTTPR